MRTLAAILLAGLALAAAGCGGGSNGSASGTTTVGTTVGTTVATTVGATVATPTAPAACRRLTTTARQGVRRIARTVASFQSAKGTGGLASRVKTLRNRIRSEADRIRAVQTPPGKLTRDKRRLAGSLHALAGQVEKARRSAANGNVVGAVRQLAASGRLAQVRRDLAAVRRDCRNA